MYAKNMDPIKLFLFFYIVNFVFQTIKLNVQHEKVVIPEVKLEKKVQEVKENKNTVKQQPVTEMKVEPQKRKMMIYYDHPVAMA